MRPVASLAVVERSGERSAGAGRMWLGESPPLVDGWMMGYITSDLVSRSLVRISQKMAGTVG